MLSSSAAFVKFIHLHTARNVSIRKIQHLYLSPFVKYFHFSYHNIYLSINKYLEFYLMVILLYNGNSFHGQKFYPHDIMIITNRKGIIIYEKIYRRASDLSRHLRSGLVFRQALSGCGRSRLRHLNRNGNCPVYKKEKNVSARELRSLQKRFFSTPSFCSVSA